MVLEQDYKECFIRVFQEGFLHGFKEGEEKNRIKIIQKFILMKFPDNSDGLLDLAIEKNVDGVDLFEILESNPNMEQMIKHLKENF